MLLSLLIRSIIDLLPTPNKPLVFTSQAAIISTALQEVDVGRYSAEELKAMTWINASGQVG